MKTYEDLKEYYIYFLQNVDVQLTSFSDPLIGSVSLSARSANISKISKSIPAKGVLFKIKL